MRWSAPRSNPVRASKAFLKESAIEYGPVVTRPEKIICVGLNYRRHAKEVGMALPESACAFQ